MNNETVIKNALFDALTKLNIEIKIDDIVIEHSKETSRGDYSSNVALKFSKLAKKAPKMFAEDIKNVLACDSIEKIEIAGPGFINFFMKNDSLTAILKEVFAKGSKFGKSEPNGKKINVEFVSANPTGDLHLGHTRVAAVGDSIANILASAGYQVTREYYLNDCGNQVNHLGHSLWARYVELLGGECLLDEDDYHGQDIIEIAKQLKDKYGDSLKEYNEENKAFFIRYGIDAEFAKIKADLEGFRVKFDVYSYESEIRKSGEIEKTIDELREKGYLYEEDGATLLKTTSFLDDKDRPVIKKTGEYTYFMPDIAYHYNKMSRGYDKLIDVLGADHHGYIARMKSALMMKGYTEDALDVELVQIVKVYRDGKEVRMSKRTGDAITHRELVSEVGVDAVRYFFTERSQSSHLDFNMNLAVEASSSNPVFYAQYAHARCASILNLASDIEIDESGKLLALPEEMTILKTLAAFKGMILSAAESRSPAKVALYIHTLAEQIHNLYAKCKIIDRRNLELTSSRLALIKACKITMANALALLGVSAPEKM